MKKIFLLAAVLLTACQHVDLPEQSDSNANVVLRFSAFSQEDFTRASVPLSDQLLRLSVAVFDSEGTKTKSVTQKASDDDFGTVGLALEAGTYDIVAIAHNGTEGNATISSTERVTFASNKVTDTFAYFGKLTVGDEQISEELTMTRRVAMVRFTATDETVNAARIKFYYTGGSSTYSPALGYGCVNSKQTEYRDCIDEDGNPVKVYEIYTFPHEESDELKVTVTPLNAEGSAMTEYVFDAVPVTRNKITTWTGTMFDGSSHGSSQSGAVTFELDTEWSGVIEYE